MKINDITFKLKDGRTAILRCPTEKDIKGIKEFLKLSAQETEFLIRTPAECVKYTDEYERKYINNINKSKNRIMIICEVDGRIAGNCGIEFYDKIKTRHRATVGIALLKEFWNLGIGTAMFSVMIELAKRNQYTKQIELQFMEGNSRARALYEKMGFRIVGLIPNAIRLGNGAFANEYIMIKEL